MVIQQIPSQNPKFPCRLSADLQPFWMWPVIFTDTTNSGYNNKSYFFYQQKPLCQLFLLKSTRNCHKTTECKPQLKLFWSFKNSDKTFKVSKELLKLCNDFNHYFNEIREIKKDFPVWYYFTSFFMLSMLPWIWTCLFYSRSPEL